MDYKKLSIGLAIVVAFLAGCLARDLGVRPVAPANAGSPPPRAGTNPPRWEYVCLRTDEDITATSNGYGANGWELAAAAGAGWGDGIGAEHEMIWWLKRPLP